jgi:hypothetical protein
MLVRSVFPCMCAISKLKAIFAANTLPQPYNHTFCPPIIIDTWKGAAEKQSSANQTQVATWLEATTSSTHALSQSDWSVEKQQGGVTAHVDYAMCVVMLSSHFVRETWLRIARYILHFPPLCRVLPCNLSSNNILLHYLNILIFTSRKPVNMRFAFVFSVLMPALAFALPAATNGDNTQVEARQVTFSSR